MTRAAVILAALLGAVVAAQHRGPLAACAFVVCATLAMHHVIAVALIVRDVREGRA